MLNNIYGLALGMSYLHSQGIIHGNLHPKNIIETVLDYPMIDDYDYNLNLKKEQNFFLKGEVIYVPPEIFNGKEYTKSSDVYSYGIILYEMLTKRKPYENLNTIEIILNVGSGKRPEIPQSVPECYRDLISRCISPNPEERPTFEQIVGLLESDSEFATEISVSIHLFDKFIEETEYRGDIYDNRRINFLSSSFYEEFNISDIKETPCYSYTKLDKIGEGSFSRVFQVVNENTGEIFAAKVSKSGYNSEDPIWKSLEKEIRILSSLDHHSIIKFVGYCSRNFIGKPFPTIIMEFAEKGSLEKLIKDEEKSISDQNWDGTKKMIITYGVASAMAYLHSRNILHMDLKADNIVITDKFFPKLSDFGCSEYISGDESSYDLGRIIGTPSHMSPEALKSNLYSKSSDVYAFGITLCELLNGHGDFEHYNFIEFVKLRTTYNKIPQIEAYVPICFQNLIMLG